MTLLFFTLTRLAHFRLKQYIFVSNNISYHSIQLTEVNCSWNFSDFCGLCFYVFRYNNTPIYATEVQCYCLTIYLCNLVHRLAEFVARDCLWVGGQPWYMQARTGQLTHYNTLIFYAETVLLRHKLLQRERETDRQTKRQTDRQIDRNAEWSLRCGPKL